MSRFGYGFSCALCLGVACSTDTFDTPDGAADVSNDVVVSDAASDAPAIVCKVTDPFVSVTQVFYRDTATGADKPITGIARFGVDELAMYFDDSSNGVLYRSTRTAITGTGASFVGRVAIATDVAQPKHGPTTTLTGLLFFDSTSTITLSDGGSVFSSIFVEGLGDAGPPTAQNVFVGASNYTLPYAANETAAFYIAAGGPPTIRRQAYNPSGTAKGSPSSPIPDTGAAAVVVNRTETIAYFSLGVGLSVQMSFGGTSWSTPQTLTVPPGTTAITPVTPTWTSSGDCHLYFLATTSTDPVPALYMASR